MNFDPLRQTGCTCSTVDDVRAAFEGKPAKLCRVHQGDAIAQREADDRRAKDLDDYARAERQFNMLRDHLAPAELDCTCLSAAAALRAHMNGTPPEPCPTHDAPTGPAPLALNDDQSLAAVIGLPLARSHTQPPLDAA